MSFWNKEDAEPTYVEKMRAQQKASLKAKLDAFRMQKERHAMQKKVMQDLLEAQKRQAAIQTQYGQQVNSQNIFDPGHMHAVYPSGITSAGLGSGYQQYPTTGVMGGGGNGGVWVGGQPTGQWPSVPLNQQWVGNWSPLYQQEYLPPVKMDPPFSLDELEAAEDFISSLEAA